MDSDYRSSSREQWSGAAEGWAKALEEPDTGASAAAARWMLEAAELEPGERVLEVACGAGRVGLRADEIVGDAGYVLCSDFAETMVEAVQAAIAARRLENVEARVLDAEQMAFPQEELFDAVLCRMGYMLMADPQTALQRTRDALKPGGRLAFAVWAEAEANPWLSIIFDAVMSHLEAPRPPPGTPGPFALASPERLRELLLAAGFEDVRIDRIEVDRAYDSASNWWEETIGLGGPLATLLGALPEEGRAAIRSAAEERAESYSGADGGLVLPAAVQAGLARRPPGLPE